MIADSGEELVFGEDGDGAEVGGGEGAAGHGDVGEVVGVLVLEGWEYVCWVGFHA